MTHASQNNPDLIDIPADIAIAAVTDQAFTTDECRDVVHCFIGTVGADWDASSAIAEIGRADRVAWINHFLWGRCLGIEVDGKVRIFDTIKPPAGMLP